MNNLFQILNTEKPNEKAANEIFYCFAPFRFAPNYAEVRFVLQEFENSGYIPETVLDYGSGSGAAFWAAFDQWGERVKSFQLIDSNEEINQFCMDVLRVCLSFFLVIIFDE